jgi:RNA methyltransferase, TrmH family
MKEIRSRTNETIKQVCSLHTAKGRRTHKQCIAEGLRACSTMLKGGYRLIQLYITQAHTDTALTLCSTDQITLVTDHVIDKLSGTTTSSGMVAVFAIPLAPKPDQLNSGVILAKLSNPGNVGALMRTCAAMGYKSAVCIDTVDPWSPKVIQASAGTIALVNIFQWSWEQVVQHTEKYQLIALVPDGGTSIDIIQRKQILLVIGNESHGIPEQWIAECNSTVTLAMTGKTESLNAAVAGSIALYICATN